MPMPIVSDEEAIKRLAEGPKEREKHKSNSAKPYFKPRMQGSGPDGTNLYQGASSRPASETSIEEEASSPHTHRGRGRSDSEHYSPRSSNIRPFHRTALEPPQKIKTPSRRTSASVPGTTRYGAAQTPGHTRSNTPASTSSPSAIARGSATQSPATPNANERGTATRPPATPNFRARGGATNSPISPSIRGRDSATMTPISPMSPSRYSALVSPTSPSGDAISYAPSASPARSSRDHSAQYDVWSLASANRRQLNALVLGENNTRHPPSLLIPGPALPQAYLTSPIQQSPSQKSEGQSSQVSPVGYTVQPAHSSQVQTPVQVGTASRPRGARPTILERPATGYQQGIALVEEALQKSKATGRDRDPPA